MAVKDKLARLAQTISTKLFVTPLGKGLYMFGGDLICVYKLLSTAIDNTSVTFEYKPYYIKVMWENSDGKRVNPTWKRIYK